MSLFKRTQINIYLPTARFFVSLFWITAIGGLICLCLWPADGSAREASADQYCMRRLHDLSKAILAYKAEHGELPQSVVGPNGHRQSWRLLLDDLRYVQSDLYRPDEAWDSAKNLEAIHEMRAAFAFQCRVATTWDLDNPFTSFVMLVRPGGNWQADLRPKAVLIVESQWSGIHLAEPRDLEIEAVFSAHHPFGVTRLYSAHEGFVRAICMDGSIIEIPTDLSKQELRDVLEGR